MGLGSTVSFNNLCNPIILLDSLLSNRKIDHKIHKHK